MLVTQWMQRALAISGVAALAACAAEVGPKVTPAGEVKSTKVAMMERSARALQVQDPVQKLAVYLVGFHALKDDPSSQMTAHHFCHSITQELAQCVLFDGNAPNANLNGIEYIISEKLYNELPQEERQYWHPHNYEILSGTLMAPGLPDIAEHDLFKLFMNSYGKTWHTWQTGMFGATQDKVPLGAPHLAWSFNHEGEAKPGLIEARDKEMKVSSSEKREKRQDLVALAHPQGGVNALSAHFPESLRSIPGVTAVEKEPKQEKALSAVQRVMEQAQRGLQDAIRQAEASLGPHQPGSGHTKVHMQRVVNLLEGADSAAYKALPDEPAPDAAVLPDLKSLRKAMDDHRPSPDAIQALDQTIQYVEAAGRHARQSIQGTSVMEVHEQAGLAAGLLVAARGQSQTNSPITGALSYLSRHLPTAATGKTGSEVSRPASVQRGGTREPAE